MHNITNINAYMQSIIVSNHTVVLLMSPSISTVRIKAAMNWLHFVIGNSNNYFSLCGWPNILPRRSQSCPIINSPRSIGGTKSELPSGKRPDEYSVGKWGASLLSAYGFSETAQTKAVSGHQGTKARAKLTQRIQNRRQLQKIFLTPLNDRITRIKLAQCFSCRVYVGPRMADHGPGWWVAVSLLWCHDEGTENN